MQGKVRSSKSTAFMGMVIGTIMIILALTTGVLKIGWFGWIWIIIAIGITVVNTYQYLTGKGPSFYDFETKDELKGSKESFDSKIRNLEQLKRDNLISENEYKTKREEIMKEKW